MSIEDYPINQQLNFLGLEYHGDVTTVPLEEKRLQAPPEFSEFLAKGNLNANYLLNPFSEHKGIIAHLIYTARVVKELSANSATVASRQGLLRDKLTGIVVYRGGFHFGFRSGQGVAPVYNRQQEYVGEYRGEWSFSMRHGYGELTYPDGSKFQGQWDHDVKNGTGLEIDAAGGKYVGSWRNNIRNGTGQFYWPDHSIESREYSNGKLVRTIPTDKNHIWPSTVKIEKSIETFFSSLKISSHNMVLSTEQLASSPSGEVAPAPGPFTAFQTKKAFRTATDTIIPKAAEVLEKLIGKKVTLEADVKSFTETQAATVAIWMLTVYDGVLVTGAITKAFTLLCRDDIVKSGVQDKIQKIVIVNKEKLRNVEVTLKDGVLSIIGAFESGDDAKLEAEPLSKLIEKLL